MVTFKVAAGNLILAMSIWSLRMCLGTSGELAGVLKEASKVAACLSCSTSCTASPFGPSVWGEA